MKKFLSMAVVATLALSIVSCGEKAEVPADDTTTELSEENTEDGTEENTDESSEDVELALVDGVYTAEEAEFNAETGYKGFVEITVANGVIESVIFDGVKEDGALKSEVSEAGEYKMVEYGGATSEWHEQADLLEASVVENQGLVDTVAGVTIDTADFAALVNEALSTAYGEVATTEEVSEEGLTDGVYTAEEAAYDDKGYKAFAEITVANGVIESVVLDAATEDGTTKSSVSEAGEYKMVEYGGASAEWHEQIDLLEESIVENQGLVDTVAGVTIDTANYSALVNEALSSAE